MRFTVFTHVVHKQHEGSLYAYAPYVREMNLWFSKVERVVVVAPLIQAPPEANECCYLHPKLEFVKIPSIQLTSAKTCLYSFLVLPGILVQLGLQMYRSHYLHLRCPGNIGLLACGLQVFFPKKQKLIKYAGNWDPGADRPWSYSLQIWILKNWILTRNARVLVYGNWASQPSQIIPCFTASFREKDLPVSSKKDYQSPFQFLFAGSLVAGKRPKKAIALIHELRKLGVPASLMVFGDGNLLESLRKEVSLRRLDTAVTFFGNCSLEELKVAYQSAHFVILLSQSEGWPKVLAEGMFFGCIPVATQVSCVNGMLNNGKRGVLVLPREVDDMESLAHRLLKLLQDPEALSVMSDEAAKWAQSYTLDHLETEILQLLHTEVLQARILNPHRNLTGN